MRSNHGAHREPKVQIVDFRLQIEKSFHSYVNHSAIYKLKAKMPVVPSVV
jgi:hypothetical protein